MTHNDDRRATVTQFESADAVGRLIARAGWRPEPPPGLESSVRAAVHAAWREEVTRQSWRRRFALAVAASVAALAAGIGWQLTQRVDTPPVAVAATVEHAFGPVRLRTEDGVLHEIVAGTATLVHAGEGLTTESDAGARVRIAGVTELRVAPQTRMTVIAPDTVRLDAGAVFIDSAKDAPALVIETPLGTVAHIGTRYQVRVTPDATTVVVRDGRIQLALGTSTEVAGRDEQLVVRIGGRVTRARVPGYGEAWHWADALAKPVRIDGLALAEFLDWAAGETGRSLDYASEDAAASARTTTLHGSIEGLTPDEAVDSVLATTDLSVRRAAGRLIVQRARDR